jgi:adenylate cyclase
MASLRTCHFPVPRMQVTQRRLAAILVGDMVGYSRLMEAHEEYTHHWTMHLRADVLEPGIAAHHGRIVKNTGDGFVAMFDSASDATRCALALQSSLTVATAEQPVEQRISFRMGVNVADIIVEADDIYGDGVNVAARLQTYAEPGGIIISGAVAEQMGSYPGVRMIDLGDLHLKNLARTVRVFDLRTHAPPSRLIGDDLLGSESRPSLAVLPFRMHPIEPEERYFADGIVDEIIHGLATLKELFVIARGSALGYGGTTLDVAAIGRTLGVRYVLYGGVRRSGGRLRIVTELSDAESNAIIRSDQYEGQLSDLFALQAKIAVDVVRTIAPHVQERELERTRRKHPQNLTAYDFVLQALDLLYRMDYESFSRARGLLQQAIAHDPDYAPAYAYIAYWYVFRVGEMGSHDPEGDASAAAHYAAAALERDGDDALSLAISGHVHAYLLKDYRTAFARFDRAIACGPSSAMAWTMSSATRGFVGDGETAVKHGEHGLRLSPLDARLFWHEGLLGQAHYVEGNYEKALEWTQSALKRNRSIRYNYRTLIATQMALGRADEAAETAREFLRTQPDFRLRTYARNCPFVPHMLAPWLERLRAAGLPE